MGPRGQRAGLSGWRLGGQARRGGKMWPARSPSGFGWRAMISGALSGSRMGLEKRAGVGLRVLGVEMHRRPLSTGGRLDLSGTRKDRGFMVVTVAHIMGLP